MPADADHHEGARLLCLALQAAAPALRALIELVHALRIHPNPKVRELANRKLQPPQRLSEAEAFDDGSTWK